MQVLVAINGLSLMALLDSRSTHNFVDTAAVQQVGLILLEHTGLYVTVANDDCINRLGCCRDLHIVAGGEPFHIDCYILALGSYDMVLSILWLESLGPIIWDFRNQTMAFIRNEHRVRCTMEGAPPQLELLAAEGDLMEELLLHFDSLFTEPTCLLL
jgi:hypothetical protein